MEMIRPSNRKFGFLFFGIFLCLAFYGLIKEGLALRFYFFTCISLFFLVANIFDLKLLTSLNNVWFKLGIILGKIVSPIVLGLIFFVLIAPLGLFLKLLGRDVLKLRRKNGKTYWSKPISEIDSESFKNQF